MLPRERSVRPHVFMETTVLHDLLWAWLLPNAAYDLVKQLIVSLTIAMGATIILGPMLKWVQGLRMISALAIILFLSVFMIFSYIRPQAASPAFAPVPLQIVTGIPGGTKDAGIILIMEIVNRGTMPSVARNWSSVKAVVDDHIYDGKPFRVVGTLPFHMLAGRIVTFHEQDLLQYKANTPIQPGASSTGILAYTFQGINPQIFYNRKTKFLVSFSDVMDRTYVVEFPMNPVSDDSIDYFPGITMEIN